MVNSFRLLPDNVQLSTVIINENGYGNKTFSCRIHFAELNFLQVLLTLSPAFLTPRRQAV